MVTRLSQNRRRGLTLVELLVVIVILGILTAIAVPTFTSITTKSKYATLTSEAYSLSDDAAALAKAHLSPASAQDPTASTPKETYVQAATADMPAIGHSITFAVISTASYQLKEWTLLVCLQVPTTTSGQASVTHGACPTPTTTSGATAPSGSGSGSTTPPATGTTPSTVALSTTPPTPAVGEPLTVIATVSGTVTQPPTGQVAWSLSGPGSPSCPVATLTTSGTVTSTADCTLATTVAGTYTLTADYSGSSIYKPASATKTVTPAYAWTELNPGPTSRWLASMAYDPAISEVVLFGGYTNQVNRRGDFYTTWTFNGTKWTDLNFAQATSPQKRYAAQMAYDPALGEVVLFGGSDAATASLNSTLAFNGTKWLALSPTSVPPDLAMATMVWDTTLQALVLFGGAQGRTTGNASTTVSNTWEFKTNTWTELSPTSSPPALLDYAMTYDPTLHKLVLFGGRTASYSLASTTWEFNGTSWSRVTVPTHPTASEGGRLVYDPGLKEDVLFGGYDHLTTYKATSYLGTMWAFNGTSWTRMHPAASPTPDCDFSMTYDTAIHKEVLFGGITPATISSATWLYYSG